MAHNPVMNRNPYFRDSAASYQGAQGQAGQQVQYDQYGRPIGYVQQVNQAGQAFANQAGAYRTFAPAGQTSATMSYDDAMMKTLLLLGVTVLSGVAAVFFVPLTAVSVVAVTTSLLALAVSFMAAFRPMVSPGIAISYAVLEGVALGTITGALNTLYPGIALQAILGTVAVVAVATGLHMSGAVRTTAKGRKVILVVMMGALVYSLVNMVLVLTGINTSFRGMDTSLSIGGIPLGIVLGLIMIVVAGYLLISDFEVARYAVDNGAPKAFAWTVAFGIASTVMWIYVEVLRVLSILASDR